MTKSTLIVLTAIACVHLTSSTVRGQRPDSVMNFGATGDGATDDSAAIQEALNNNLTVYFPPGVYVAADLKLRDGQTLACASNSTTILKFKDGQSPGTRLINGINVTGIRIRNCGLDGNKRAQHSDAILQQSHILFFSSATDVQITGNRMLDASGDAISLWAPRGAKPCARVLVANNTILAPRRQGIALLSVDGAVIENNLVVDGSASGIHSEPDDSERWLTGVSVRGNTVKQCGYGIAMGGICEFKDPRFGVVSVVNNIVEGTTRGNGIEMLCLPNSTVALNIVRGSLDQGIWVRAGSVTVEGNQVSGSKNEGIQVESYKANQALSVTVTGNVLTRNGGNAAIFLVNAVGSNISGNSIYNPTSTGIRVYGYSSQNVIANNAIISDTPMVTGEGIWLQSATSHNTVSGNTVKGFPRTINNQNESNRIH